ncbi:NAD-dependent epimerase/dehydratase family protein [Pseudohongiella sp. O18]|uniref:NAD-dependent epimerase/dehydratase family protein n=1 Tax=Pseudohongiella sp. O18 TaxID=2904248 RepID=UPI001F02AEB4|nr:NAD-dependent epimerase/dehydratase family protein [Pseudohongiella sp. O18]
MTKALVLGGTGAMGAHLVDLLEDEGYQVYVTTRKNRTPHGSIKYIVGDAKDSAFIDTLVGSNWDVIVDFMHYSTQIFECRVTRFLNSTRQYVYLSSARVYADSSSSIGENHPRLLDTSRDTSFLESDEYAIEKAQQEDVLLNTGLNNWTIVRPYITFSENRLQLGIFEKEGWLYRALRGRTIIFSQDMNEKITTLSYGLEIAVMIKSVIGNPEALGRIYNTTTSEHIRWNSVIKIYLDCIENFNGSRPKVLLVGEQELMKCKPVKYQFKYDRIYDRKFDSSEVLQFCPDLNFRSVSESLASCVEKFLERREFNQIDWRSEAIKDRICGEMAELSEIPGLRRKLQYIFYRFAILKPRVEGR